MPILLLSSRANVAHVLATDRRLGPPSPLTTPRWQRLVSTYEIVEKTLVATREGGWLSGEEEIRERLGMLYGAVNFYDGRPTDPQLNEMAVLAKELEAKQAAFDAIVAKDVAAANKSLVAKKLDALKLMSHEEWDKKEPGSGTPAATVLLPRF